MPIIIVQGSNASERAWQHPMVKQRNRWPVRKLINRLIAAVRQSETTRRLLHVACPHARTTAFDPDVRLKQRGALTCHSDFWRVCRSKTSRAVAVRNVGVCIFVHTGVASSTHQAKRNPITFTQNSSLALSGTAVR